MSSPADEIDAALLRVANAGIADLEALLPLPVEALAKGLLALPPVAELKDKLVADVAGIVSKGVADVESKASELAPDWLKGLVVAAQPPPPVAFSCSQKAEAKLATMTVEQIDAALGVS